MIRRLKSVIHFSVLITLCSWNSEDFLNELQASYDHYTDRYPHTRVVLLFNQPVYHPGDTAFFSAWYTDMGYNFIKGANTLTADLIAGDGRTVQRVKFNVMDGKGKNQIVLRKNLAAGVYRLISYSDWMKNFGNSHFYQKTFVVHDRKEIASSTIEKIGIFPEGGSLVAGVQNKIIFTGPPLDRLTVSDQLDNNIATISLDSTGIGRMYFTPQKGSEYALEAFQPRRKIRFPNVREDAVSIRLDSSKNDRFKIMISPDSRLASEELYAVICTNGKIVSKQVLSDVKKGAEIAFTPLNSMEALYQVFVFSRDKKLIGQRVFYHAGLQPQVSFRLPDKVKQRERISGAIKILNNTGQEVRGEMSVTAIQQDLFKHRKWHSLPFVDIPQAADWLERFGSKEERAINDFLITQKWDRIDWTKILSGTPLATRFQFRSNLNLTGTVRQKNDGGLPPDSTILLAYLHRNTNGYEVPVRKGRFELPFVYPFWGDDEIFCTLQSKDKTIDDDFEIVIEKDSINPGNNWTSGEIDTRSVYGEYAYTRGLISESYSFYKNEKNIPLTGEKPNEVFEEELPAPDHVVNVGDYVVFPTMQDLLHEVVPFVRMRKKGSEELVRISYRLNNTSASFREEPLYIIDGVMTKKTMHFLRLKPENLLTIKIINNPNKLTQMGKLGANGIILVESRKISQQSLPDENIFSVTGLSAPMEFKGVAVESSSRTPMLRPTTFWTAFLACKPNAPAEVNFNASDEIGVMKVIVSGLTSDNMPFYGEHLINVEFNREDKN